MKLNKTKKWLKNALLLWGPHNLTKKVTGKGEEWMKDNFIYTRLTTSVWHRKLVKNSQKLFYWYQKTINGNFLSHEHAYLKTALHTMKVYNTDQLASPSKFCSWSLSFFSTTNHLFQSNQRFQAIEYVDRPVLVKFDFFCSFLFYLWYCKHSAWQSSTKLPVQTHPWHTRNVRRVIEVTCSSSWGFNHWYLKYL